MKGDALVTGIGIALGLLLLLSVLVYLFRQATSLQHRERAAVLDFEVADDAEEQAEAILETRTESSEEE